VIFCPGVTWSHTFHKMLKSSVTLFPHQIKAVNWMTNRENQGLGGVLADEMGLGKTFEIMGLLSKMKGKTLVICPLSLLEQWKSELFNNMVLKKSDISIIYGIPSDRNSISNLFRVKHSIICLSTYDVIKNDIDKAHSIINIVSFDRIVLDEAHVIRSNDSLRFKAILKLTIKTKFNWCLTGTPFNNSISDLASLAQIVNQDKYNDLDQWNHVKLVIDSNQPIPFLQEWTQDCVLKRLKNDVLDLLPPIVKTIKQFVFNTQQADLYNEFRLNAKNSFENNGPFLHIIVCILRMRQICVHPFLVTKQKKDPNLTDRQWAQQIMSMSGKFKCINEICRKVPKNEKIIIFSQWPSVFKLLGTAFDAMNAKYTQLDGKTSLSDRQHNIRLFNTDPKIRFFFISTKAGGVGLNLTKANHVIFMDPLFNPFAEMQASDRVHRIGQQKQVHIYKLYVPESVETWVQKIKQRKNILSHNCFNLDKPHQDNITKKDLKELFDNFIDLPLTVKEKTAVSF